MEKKPEPLQKALDKSETLSDDWFGSEKASLEDLPSISAKKNMTRTSVFIHKDDLIALKNISKKVHVPVSRIMGEIISQYVMRLKKESKV